MGPKKLEKKLRKEEKIKKAITIEKKKEIGQKYESGVRVTDLANMYSMSTGMGDPLPVPIEFWVRLLALLSDPDQDAKTRGNMQVIRPKSAKGRPRPKVTSAFSVDTERVNQKAMFPPQPPLCPPSTASQRFDPSLRSGLVLKSSSKLSSDEPAEVVEKVLVPSLNRYMVLPSIKKRADSAQYIDEKTAKLSLSDSIHSQQVSRRCSNAASRSNPKTDKASRAHGPAKMPSGTEENDLLLAVRNPSGQRFQCHFRPTDTLQVVVAAAEARFGGRYESALIETMEIPRKRFTNLRATLSQCGIFNKSVLCIGLEDDATDSCGEEDVT